MKKHLVLLLPIFLITFAVYFGVWNFGFVLDDGHIVNNPLIHSIFPLSKFFTNPGVWLGNQENPQDWRPVGAFAVAVSWSLFSYHAGYYHVLNVILHLLDLGLIYWFIFRFSGKRWLAAAIALLIGIHPTLTEAVSFTSSQTGLLWAAFFLITCILILYDKWPVLSWLAFAMAILTKESALPGVVPIFLIFWLRSPDRKVVRAAIKSLPYILTALVFVILWIIVIPPVQNQPMPTILVAPYTVWRYLSATFWPANLIVLDTQGSRFYPHGIFDPGVIPGIAVITLILGLIYLAWRKKWTEELLGFTWFAVFLTPFLQIVKPTSGIIGTRALYVPLIGLFLGLFSILRRLADRFGLFWRRWSVIGAQIIGVVIVLMLSDAAFARSQDWKNGETLWASAIRIDPGNVFARVTLANFYLGERQDPERALEISKENIAMFPGHFNSWLALADSYAALGDATQAQKEYLSLLAVYPWSDRVQAHLNALYHGLGIDSGIKIHVVGEASAYFEIRGASEKGLIIHWQERIKKDFRVFLKPGEYYIRRGDEVSDKFTIAAHSWLLITLK